MIDRLKFIIRCNYAFNRGTKRQKDIVESIGIPEDVIKISKSKAGSEIEGKTKSSLEKARLSKQKLQEAKDFVKNLVKRNSE